MRTDLVKVSATRKPCGAVCFNDHQGCSFGAFAWIGLCGNNDEVGVLTIGDKDFLSGKPVRIALFDRACLDRLDIRAARRFGHRQSADQLTGNHLRQKALFLLFRTALQNIMRNDAGVDAVAPAREIGA